MSFQNVVNIVTVPRGCYKKNERTFLKCSAVFSLSLEVFKENEGQGVHLTKQAALDALKNWPIISGLFEDRGDRYEHASDLPIKFFIGATEITREIQLSRDRVNAITARGRDSDLPTGVPEADRLGNARKVFWSHLIGKDSKIWASPVNPDSQGAAPGNDAANRKAAIRMGAATIEGLRFDDINPVVIAGMAIEARRSEAGATDPAAKPPPSETLPEEQRSQWHKELRKMEQAVERQNLLGSSGATSGALEREYEADPTVERTENDLRNEFHHRLAALDEYPHLQLLVGLILDFEVEVDSSVRRNEQITVHTDLAETEFATKALKTKVVISSEPKDFYALTQDNSFLNAQSRCIDPDALDTVQWDLQSGLRSVLRSNGYLDDTNRLHPAQPPSGYGVTVFWKKEKGFDLAKEIGNLRLGAENKKAGENRHDEAGSEGTAPGSPAAVLPAVAPEVFNADANAEAAPPGLEQPSDETQEVKVLHAEDLSIGILPAVKVGNRENGNEWRSITARELTLHLDDGTVLQWNDEKPLTPSNVEAPQPLTGWVIDLYDGTGKGDEFFVVSTAIGLVAVAPNRIKSTGPLANWIPKEESESTDFTLGHYVEFRVEREQESGRYRMLHSDMRLGQGLAGPVKRFERISDYGNTATCSLRLERYHVKDGSRSRFLTSVYLRGTKDKVDDLNKRCQPEDEAPPKTLFFQGRGEQALVVISPGEGVEMNGIIEISLDVLSTPRDGIPVRYLFQSEGFLHFELADPDLDEGVRESAREILLRPTVGLTKVASATDPETIDLATLVERTVYRLKTAFFFDSNDPGKSEIRVQRLEEESRPESARFLGMGILRGDGGTTESFYAEFTYGPAASASVAYRIDSSDEPIVELVGQQSTNTLWSRTETGLKETEESFDDSSEGQMHLLRRGKWSALGPLIGERDECFLEYAIIPEKDRPRDLQNREIRARLTKVRVLWHDQSRTLIGWIQRSERSPARSERRFTLTRFDPAGKDNGIKQDFEIDERTVIVALPDPDPAKTASELRIWNHPPLDVPLRVTFEYPGSTKATHVEVLNRVELQFSDIEYDDNATDAQSVKPLNIPSGLLTTNALKFDLGGGQFPYELLRKEATKGGLRRNLRVFLETRPEIQDQKRFKLVLDIEGKRGKEGNGIVWTFAEKKFAVQGDNHPVESEGEFLRISLSDGSDVSRADTIVSNQAKQEPLLIQIVEAPDRSWVPIDKVAETPRKTEKNFTMNEAVAIVLTAPSESHEVEAGVRVPVFVEAGSIPHRHMLYELLRLAHESALPLETNAVTGLFIDEAHEVSKDWDLIELGSDISTQHSPSLISKPEAPRLFRAALDSSCLGPQAEANDNSGIIEFDWLFSDGKSITGLLDVAVNGVAPTEPYFRSSDQILIDDVLMQWNGWSLAVPPPHWVRGLLSAEEVPKIEELFCQLSEQSGNDFTPLYQRWQKKLPKDLQNTIRCGDSNPSDESRHLLLEALNNSLADLARVSDEKIDAGGAFLNLLEETASKLMKTRKPHRRDRPWLARRRLEDRFPELVIRPLLDVETSLPGNGDPSGPKSLPRLRASTEYQFTFRSVDLAGHFVEASVPKDKGLSFRPFSKDFRSPSGKTLRFLPIGPPVVWRAGTDANALIEDAKLDEAFPTQFDILTARRENLPGTKKVEEQGGLELSMCRPPVHWKLAEWLGAFDGNGADKSFAQIAYSDDWKAVPGYRVKDSAVGLWHDTVMDPNVDGYLIVCTGLSAGIDIAPDEDAANPMGTVSKMQWSRAILFVERGERSSIKTMTLERASRKVVSSNPRSGDLPEWEKFQEFKKDPSRDATLPIPEDADWEVRIYAIPDKNTLNSMPLLALASPEKKEGVTENGKANEFFLAAKEILKGFSGNGQLTHQQEARLLVHPWTSTPRILRVRHITNQPYQAPERDSLNLVRQRLGQTDALVRYKAKVHRPSTGAVVLQAALEEEYVDDPRSPLPRVPDEELMRILEDPSLRREARQRLLDWEHEMERVRTSLRKDRTSPQQTGKSGNDAGEPGEEGEPALRYLGRSSDLTAYLGRPPLDVTTIVPSDGVHVEAHGPDLHSCQFEHEFFDTRHRTVYYRGVAKTRYGHLPEAFGEDGVQTNPPTLHGELAPSDSWERVEVLSTIRPSNVVINDVSIVFDRLGGRGSDARTWRETWDGRWQFSRTRRCGHRIWLERPWYSSGSGEKLAVLLMMDANVGWDQAGEYFELASRWGMDPVFETKMPVANGENPGPGLLTRQDFIAPWSSPAGLRSQPIRNTVDAPPHTVSDGAAVDGEEAPAPSPPEIEQAVVDRLPVGLAVYQPRFDSDRRLWFADIFVEPKSYCPFVTYTVARYQPCSIPHAALSAPERLHPVQILPPRTLTVEASASGMIQLKLRLSGIFPSQNRRRIVVRIERNEFVEEAASYSQSEAPVFQTDLGWEPVPLLDKTGSLVEGVVIDSPEVVPSSPTNRNGAVEIEVVLPEVPFHHSRLADRKGESASDERDDSHPCRHLRLSVAEDEIFPAAHAMPEDQRFLPRRIYLEQVFLPLGLLERARQEPDLRGPTHEGGPSAEEQKAGRTTDYSRPLKSSHHPVY